MFNKKSSNKATKPSLLKYGFSTRRAVAKNCHLDLQITIFSSTIANSNAVSRRPRGEAQPSLFVADTESSSESSNVSDNESEASVETLPCSEHDSGRHSGQWRSQSLASNHSNRSSRSDGRRSDGTFEAPRGSRQNANQSPKPKPSPKKRASSRRESDEEGTHESLFDQTDRLFDRLTEDLVHFSVSSSENSSATSVSPRPSRPRTPTGSPGRASEGESMASPKLRRSSHRTRRHSLRLLRLRRQYSATTQHETPLINLLRQGFLFSAGLCRRLKRGKDTGIQCRRGTKRARPLLPKTRQRYNLYVVLDIDETIVAARNEPILIRPFFARLIKMLHRMSCEIVLWTAGTRDYIEPIIDTLTHHLGVWAPLLRRLRCKRPHCPGVSMGRWFHYLITRDESWYCEGSGAKDLGLLQRPMNRVLVIENNPASVQLYPGNALLVQDYDEVNPEDASLAIVSKVVEECASSSSPVPEILVRHTELAPVTFSLPACFSVNNAPVNISVQGLLYSPPRCERRVYSGEPPVSVNGILQPL